MSDEILTRDYDGKLRFIGVWSQKSVQVYKNLF